MRHKIIEHWKKFFEQNYITEDDQVDIDWAMALYEDLFQKQLQKEAIVQLQQLEQIKELESQLKERGDFKARLDDALIEIEERREFPNG